MRCPYCDGNLFGRGPCYICSVCGASVDADDEVE